MYSIKSFSSFLFMIQIQKWIWTETCVFDIATHDDIACLTSVARRDDEQSRALALKRGLWRNPVSDSILADILCSILHFGLWDAKYYRWQLHSYPLSSKWPHQAWKCVLASQLRIFFNAMKALLMLWLLNFTHDCCLWQMNGIVLTKLFSHRITSLDLHVWNIYCSWEPMLQYRVHTFLNHPISCILYVNK